LISTGLDIDSKNNAKTALIKRSEIMKKQHLFINGKWLVAQTYRPLYSPYSGLQIAEVAFANKEEIEMALQAAETAKDRMATMPLHERAAILERLVQL
jgi:acyl-CoA reductase-like NAD-dependent aldehyde dehydrogenase